MRATSSASPRGWRERAWPSRGLSGSRRIQFRFQKTLACGNLELLGKREVLPGVSGVSPGRCLSASQDGRRRQTRSKSRCPFGVATGSVFVAVGGPCNGRSFRYRFRCCSRPVSNSSSICEPPDRSGWKSRPSSCFVPMTSSNRRGAAANSDRRIDRSRPRRRSACGLCCPASAPTRLVQALVSTFALMSH